MKTEGDFNAWMSKEYKRRSPNIMALKVSDRFQKGIADFIVWKNGKSIAHENKAISNFPSSLDKLILKHTFDGAQQTWLETFELAGNRSYGIIAVLKLGKFYVFDRKYIPPSGNFKMSEFQAIPKQVFGFDQFNEFLGEYM